MYSFLFMQCACCLPSISVFFSLHVQGLCYLESRSKEQEELSEPSGIKSIQLYCKKVKYKTLIYLNCIQLQDILAFIRKEKKMKKF